MKCSNKIPPICITPEITGTTEKPGNSRGKPKISAELMPLRAGDGQLPQKLQAFTSLCRKNHSGGRNIMRSSETKPASPRFLTRHPQRVDGSFFMGVRGCFLLAFYLPFNCHVSRPCSCVCFISSSPAVPAGRAAAIKLRTRVFAEVGPLWDGKPEPASLLPEERSPLSPCAPPTRPTSPCAPSGGTGGARLLL